MLKSTFLSLFLGLITLQGCTSTTPKTSGCASNADCSGTPTTPVCNTATSQCVACLANTDCSTTPATPVCNITSNTCAAETTTACNPNSTYCATVAPGMTCNSTGTCVCGAGTATCAAGQECTTATSTCVAWPRLAFLTKNNYTLGTAYSETSNSIKNKADADSACQAEYIVNKTTYTDFPNKMFKAVMATTGSSMYQNTYAFAKNPRVINDLVAFQNNGNAALTTPTADPLSATAASTCSATVPGFDCIGPATGGAASKFQITELATGNPQAYWTGAVPVASFATGDASGFFTAGTDVSTCTSWGLTTSLTPGAANDGGNNTSKNYGWNSYTSLNCAGKALLLCLESD